MDMNRNELDDVHITMSNLEAAELAESIEDIDPHGWGDQPLVVYFVERLRELALGG
jgi:hypothetical protein